jgi:hypothetical protein
VTEPEIRAALGLPTDEELGALMRRITEQLRPAIEAWAQMINRMGHAYARALADAYPLGHHHPEAMVWPPSIRYPWPPIEDSEPEDLRCAPAPQPGHPPREQHPHPTP